MTSAVEQVIQELSFKEASILKLHFALPLFDSIIVFAFVLYLTWNDLSSLSVLQVVAKISNIKLAISACIVAFAIGLVVDPFSFINISTGMDQSAEPLSFVFEPLAFIDRAIRPDLLAESISLAFKPLPLVMGFI